MSRVASAAALAALASAAPLWSQTSGGRARAGIFPPSIVEDSTGAAAALAVPLSARLPPRGAPRVRDPSGPTPYVVQDVGSLEFSMDASTAGSFVAQKCPPIVIGANKELLVTTPGGTVFGLTDPDDPNGVQRWQGQPGTTPEDWRFTQPFDSAGDSWTFDIALDDNSNGYIAVEKRNQLVTDLWSFDSSGNGANPPARLGSNLRFFETNHISLLEAGGSVWVPTLSALNNIGMSVVDEPGAGVTDFCVSNGTAGNCQGGMTGSAWLPGVSASQSGPANTLCPTGCAIVLNAWSDRSVAAYLYAPPLPGDGPTTPIPSAALFLASNNQPNPIVDVWKMRAYWTGINQKILEGEPLFQLYCLDASLPVDGSGNAQSCSGYGTAAHSGNTIPPLWPLVTTGQQFEIEWIYGAAMLLKTPYSQQLGIDRLLYSITLAELDEVSAPIGCIFSVRPETAGPNADVADSYCITRDTLGKDGVFNYLATSPVIFVEKAGLDRPQPASTAFVAAFDCLIYAFDPLNLAAGPLYVLNPLSANSLDTIATDHLTVTAGGSLAFSGWDDNDNEFSAWVVPGVIAYSMTPSPIGSPSQTPSPSPSRTGYRASSTATATATARAAAAAGPPPLSAGAGAGIAIAVLVSLGGAGFYLSSTGALAKLLAGAGLGGGGGYGAFGSNVGVASPKLGSAFKGAAAASSTSGATAGSAFKAAGYNSI